MSQMKMSVQRVLWVTQTAEHSKASLGLKARFLDQVAKQICTDLPWEGECQLGFRDSGKPCVVHPTWAVDADFSVSHHGQWTVLAGRIGGGGRHEVGVDVLNFEELAGLSSISVSVSVSLSVSVSVSLSLSSSMAVSFGRLVTVFVFVFVSLSPSLALALPDSASRWPVDSFLDTFRPAFSALEWRALKALHNHATTSASGLEDEAHPYPSRHVNHCTWLLGWLWCMKEAVLKASGVGLHASPACVAFHPAAVLRHTLPFIACEKAPQARAALCAFWNSCVVDIYDNLDLHLAADTETFPNFGFHMLDANHICVVYETVPE
jgi:phosphopantetheinyl transferase